MIQQVVGLLAQYSDDEILHQFRQPLRNGYIGPRFAHDWRLCVCVWFSGNTTRRSESETILLSISEGSFFCFKLSAETNK